MQRKKLDNLSSLGYIKIMKAMAVGELKSRFSEVLEEVQQGHKIGILYGRAKKPVAMITPYKKENKGRRKIGILNGKASIEFVGDGKFNSIEEFLGEIPT